jgi:hypothetical protein
MYKGTAVQYDNPVVYVKENQNVIKPVLLIVGTMAVLYFGYNIYEYTKETRMEDELDRKEQEDNTYRRIRRRPNQWNLFGRPNQWNQFGRPQQWNQFGRPQQWNQFGRPQQWNQFGRHVYV